MPDLYVNSPLFGRCRLVPHPGDEAPTLGVVGYVELEGQEGKLKVGMHLGKGWRTHRDRPINRKITRWFHMEREGTPLFTGIGFANEA